MLISPNSFPDCSKLFTPNHAITAGTVNAISKLLIIDCSGCFSKGNPYYNFVFALSSVAVLLLVSFLLSAHEYFYFLSVPVCSPGLPDTFSLTVSLPDPMNSAVSVPCPVLSSLPYKPSLLPVHFHIHSSVVSDLRYAAVTLIAGDKPAVVGLFWIFYIVDDGTDRLADRAALAGVQRYDACGGHVGVRLLSQK